MMLFDFVAGRDRRLAIDHDSRESWELILPSRRPDRTGALAADAPVTQLAEP